MAVRANNRQSGLASVRVAFGPSCLEQNRGLRVEAIDSIAKDAQQEMLRSFNRFGWVLLEVEDGEGSVRDNLLALRSIFGSPVLHDRSEHDGITIVESKVHGKPTANTYLSACNSAHPPHTGGTASAHPPTIVALACERTSKVGGLTQIVSGKLVYDYLKSVSPEGLKALENPKAVEFRRGGDRAQKAVFETLSPRWSAISFRYDSVALVTPSPRAEEAYELVRRFVNDSGNQVVFRLAPRQICVFDNRAVLHGRTAFEADSARRLYRLNLDGSSLVGLKIGFPTSDHEARSHLGTFDAR